AEFDERVPRAVHLVWGMMETKDAHAFIAPFKGLVERVYTVPIPEETNAFSAEALAEIAASERFDVTPTAGIAHALMQSKAVLGRRGRVLFCGSLCLAGHVLKLYGRWAGATPILPFIQSASLFFGSAPVWVAASWPSLKIISVGIARTL